MDPASETPWFQRSWSFDEPADLYPMQVERLRGTAARLAEHLRGLAPEIASRPPAAGWSVLRHLGHLVDLEPLWSVRVEGLLSGAEVLAAADLENRATEEADHDRRATEELLDEFRRARGALVARLDALEPTDFARTSAHPRLGTPMRLCDLCRFVADHDDHHLVRIHRLISGAPGPR